MTFRQWVQEKWYEHLEELDAYHITPEPSARVYFNKYKWWLRRQYKIEEGLPKLRGEKCLGDGKCQDQGCPAHYATVGDKDHWINRMDEDE